MTLYLVSKNGSKKAYQSLDLAIKMVGVKDSSFEDVKRIVESSDKPLVIGTTFIEKIEYDSSLI